jgi:hypothetical protein
MFPDKSQKKAPNNSIFPGFSHGFPMVFTATSRNAQAP